VDPLVSVEEFNTYLQRTVDPDVGAMAVANASGIVRDFCRWNISAEQTTFVCDGSGTTILNLPTLHLFGVDEVRVDGVVLTPPNDDNTVGDYQWSANGQLVRTDGNVWPARFRCAQADVGHGYDTTPDAVRAVVLVLAARVATNPEGLRSKTVGAVSRSFVFETMRGDLSELQIAQISAYRLP
jgi:hypothetical protein